MHAWRRTLPEVSTGAIKRSTVSPFVPEDSHANGGVPCDDDLRLDLSPAAWPNSAVPWVWFRAPSSRQQSMGSAARQNGTTDRNGWRITPRFART